jgi:hypothetical protein
MFGDRKESPRERGGDTSFPHHDDRDLRMGECIVTSVGGGNNNPSYLYALYSCPVREARQLLPTSSCSCSETHE